MFDLLSKYHLYLMKNNAPDEEIFIYLFFKNYLRRHDFRIGYSFD